MRSLCEGRITVKEVEPCSRQSCSRWMALRDRSERYRLQPRLRKARRYRGQLQDGVLEVVIPAPKQEAKRAVTIKPKTA